MYVDAVILTALPKEHQAVVEILHSKRSTLYKGEQGKYDIFTLGTDTTVAVPDPMRSGVTNAALGTSRVLHDLAPSLILLSGIAAGMEDDPRSVRERARARGRRRGLQPPRATDLGDIVVSNEITDYTMDKTIEDNRRRAVSQPRDKSLDFSEVLPNSIFARMRIGKRSRPDRRFDSSWSAGTIVKGGHRHRPAIHVGKVLCGNSVLASDTAKLKLTQERPYKLLALEMESAGVARCLKSLPASQCPEYLMVKSLCDWGGTTKDDSWQEYCAHVAALYCIHLLQTEAFRDAMHQRRRPGQAAEHLKAKLESARECFFQSVPVKNDYIRDTATAILDSAHKELTDLSRLGQKDSLPYQFSLSPNRQFLLRAKPFFEKASRIYVTSIDTVSTFWINKHYEQDAADYLRSQQGNVTRLFVFSTPDKLVDHKYVLDAHCEQYKNVFVCSLDHYSREVLKRICPKHQQQYLEADFAILEFPDKCSYFAELGKRILLLDKLDPNSQYIRGNETIKLFNEFHSIRAGQIHDSVLRWAPNLSKQKNWTDLLKEMFDKNADVFHMIVLDINDSDYRLVRAKLAQIKYNLLEEGAALRTKHDIKNIWLMKRLADGTIDPRDSSGGLLRLSQSCPGNYVLMIQFGSKGNLVEFCKDKEVSQFRLDLYQTVDERIRILLESTEGAKVRNLDNNTRFDFIEAMAAHKLHRMDFVNDEFIEHLENKKPYQPFALQDAVPPKSRGRDGKRRQRRS